MSIFLGGKHRKIFSPNKKACNHENVREEKKEQDIEDQYYSTDTYLETRSHNDDSARNSFSISKYFGQSNIADDRINLDAFIEVRNEHDDIINTLENPIIPTKPERMESSDVDLMNRALKCIQTRNFDELMEILKQNSSISLKEILSNTKGINEAKDGGTMLHILVSMKPILKMKKMKTRSSIEINFISAVPETLLKYIIENQPRALHMTDNKGRMPLHRATLSMLKFAKEISLMASQYEMIQCTTDSEINHVRLLLTHKASVASFADSYGNLPIHYAASASSDFVDLNNILYFGKKETHLPTALDAMKDLLRAYPKGVLVPNKKGMLPLHITCSKRKKINEECLSLLLLCHQLESGLPVEPDIKGDTPLIVAIRNGASGSVIRSFGQLSDGSISSSLFIQRDARNNNPLHVALIHRPHPNVDVVNAILDIAPFTASTPDGEGIMPIRRATKFRLPPYIIRKMLSRDMPIELGVSGSNHGLDIQGNRDVTIPTSLRKSRTVANHVVGRAHHHSWWHVIVECENNYIDMVSSFLSEEATHFQIMSLVRQVGPNGYSIVINCVNDKCLLMFHSLLRFYDRYEILLSTDASNIACDDDADGVQRYVVFDHGSMFSPLHSMSFEKARRTLSKSRVFQIENNVHTESCIEVSLLPNKDRKMLLRCYQQDEAFHAEVKVREKYQFPEEYFEQIYKTHYDATYTHLTLSKAEKLCCITFENPDHTLDEVFASVSGSSRSRTWIEKCTVVLRQLANGIKIVHDQNLIHGYLTPSNVCKYGNKWKICKLGTVTKIGSAVRGPFRASTPPECIKVVRSSRRQATSSIFSQVHETSGIGNSGSRRRVLIATPKENSSFRDNFEVGEKVKFTPIVMKRVIQYNGEVEISEQQSIMTKGEESLGKSTSPPNSSPLASMFRSKSEISLFQSPKSPFLFNSKKYDNDEDEIIVYSSDGILATPAFDMWGFGVIMANILLGRCMNLPTFEKADDAIMKKLYFYNNEELEKICKKVESCVGVDAADLIRKLLQKDPRNRPQSMDEVLSHVYFHSSVIYI